MKSTLTLKGDVSNWDTLEYPCMGIDPDDKLVVLFQEIEMGTVINKGSNKVLELGDWCDNWDMDNFTPVSKGTKVVLEA